MKPPDAGRVRPFAVRVWHSPLARGVDRAEATVTWSVLLVWLLALPLLAVVGSVLWSDLQARAADEQRELVQVDATLVNDAGYVLTTVASAATGVTAEASWLGRDGQVTTATINATPGARAGDHVAIWLDPAGRVAPAPMSQQEAAIEAVLVVTISWMSLGLVLAATWWLVRRRLDRRRWHAWAQEWAVVEPGGGPR